MHPFQPAIDKTPTNQFSTRPPPKFVCNFCQQDFSSIEDRREHLTLCSSFPASNHTPIPTQQTRTVIRPTHSHPPYDGCDCPYDPRDPFAPRLTVKCTPATSFNCPSFPTNQPPTPRDHAAVPPNERIVMTQQHPGPHVTFGEIVYHDHMRTFQSDQGYIDASFLPETHFAGPGNVTAGFQTANYSPGYSGDFVQQRDLQSEAGGWDTVPPESTNWPQAP